MAPRRHVDVELFLEASKKKTRSTQHAGGGGRRELEIEKDLLPQESYTKKEKEKEKTKPSEHAARPPSHFFHLFQMADGRSI